MLSVPEVMPLGDRVKLSDSGVPLSSAGDTVCDPGETPTVAGEPLSGTASSLSGPEAMPRGSGVTLSEAGVTGANAGETPSTACETPAEPDETLSVPGVTLPGTDVTPSEPDETLAGVAVTSPDAKISPGHPVTPSEPGVTLSELGETVPEAGATFSIARAASPGARVTPSAAVETNPAPDETDSAPGETVSKPDDETVSRRGVTFSWAGWASCAAASMAEPERGGSACSASRSEWTEPTVVVDSRPAADAEPGASAANAGDAWSETAGPVVGRAWACASCAGALAASARVGAAAGGGGPNCLTGVNVSAMSPAAVRVEVACSTRVPTSSADALVAPAAVCAPLAGVAVDGVVATVGA
jgi:hypothetical protein